MIERMRLTILTPEIRMLRAGPADKILAEDANGYFCLLPRHADFLTVLVPGIITSWEGTLPRYWAVDGGILVKYGADVKISVRNAVPGKKLRELEEAVRDRLSTFDEREEGMKRAMEQLEAGFIRRFVELEQLGG